MLDWPYRERLFQVWLYTVSHCQLLLRSNKQADGQSRVDVLFKGVAAMRIIPVFHNLQITDWPDTVEFPEIGLATYGRKVFSLRAREFEGWVIAGSMSVHEDDGNYYDPSPLLEGYDPTRRESDK